MLKLPTLDLIASEVLARKPLASAEYAWIEIPRLRRVGKRVLLLRREMVL